MAFPGQPSLFPFPPETTSGGVLTIAPTTPTIPTTRAATKTRATRSPTPFQPSTQVPDSSTTGSGGGMSGGAIAGLVVGAIVILVGSVFGGMILLKKRRKRLLVSGRKYDSDNGYPEVVSNRAGGPKRGTFDYDDEEEKSSRGGGGGLASLFSGLLGQTRKVAGGNNNNNTKNKALSRSVAASAIPSARQQQQQQSWAMTPSMASTGVPLLRGMDQQQQYQQARMASPTPSFPTHQSGSLPPTGPLVLPGTYQHQQQQQPTPQDLYHQQAYQQQQSIPVSGYAGAGQGYTQYAQPRSGVEQSITAPASQPYVYQPGTGLVSVPLTLPPQPNVYPQQQQHLQQQPTQYGQPPAPYAAHNQFQLPVPNAAPVVNNVAYNAWPTASTAVVPPVVPQNQYHHQQQQPVSFPHPPPPAAAVAPVTPARSPRPESVPIFLPGDASRPLLGQGLFKVVPDAEDEEEEARAGAALAAAAAAAATPDNRPLSSSSRPSSGYLQANPPLDLNLGGDFLSSVLNYENQDQRFQSLRAMSERPMTPTVPEEDLQGSMTREEFEEYKRTPGYHDRLAGQKDRPRNQPRFLIDKEEIADEQQKWGHSRSGSNMRDESEIVIVGSDVVLEPLPSAKASSSNNRPRVITSVQNRGQDEDEESLKSNPYHPSQHQQGYPLASPTSSSAAQSPTSEPRRTTLARQPTLGDFLPTMGTEEYLERTDDKEEYSFGLHGDASSSADGGTSASASRAATPLIHHPATRIAPAKGAAALQADAFSPPVSPASPSSTTAAYRPMTDLSKPSTVKSSPLLAATGVPPPPPPKSPQPSSSTPNASTPPTIVRATKPKRN
ncbi:hypothetical protein BGZ83_000135 [Gryganskiella cystojenkinii]|nr:hypothetical protein BGZ83_000135 [Gryganskiella cystojenkinii]